MLISNNRETHKAKAKIDFAHLFPHKSVLTLRFKRTGSLMFVQGTSNHTTPMPETPKASPRPHGEKHAAIPEHPRITLSRHGTLSSSEPDLFRLVEKERATTVDVDRWKHEGLGYVRAYCVSSCCMTTGHGSEQLEEQQEKLSECIARQHGS